MYNLCNGFFSDEQEIITAINNGMLRVFKNIIQYDADKGDIITWIYAIVRNEALTMVRNKKTIIITKELHTEFIDKVYDNAFTNNLLEDVYVYLGKLSFDTRAACNLYYLEGYGIREIAIALDMREGRKKLQNIFNPNAKQASKVG